MLAPGLSDEMCGRVAAVLARAAHAERASNLLAERIRDERLGPEAAELLSGLVYGVLRRELRLTSALEALCAGPPLALRTERGTGEWLRLVVAGAMLEPAYALTVPAARALCSGVPWEGLAAADRELSERAALPAQVALAGSLPDWLATRLLEEYPGDALGLAASLSEPPPRSLRANTLRCGAQELRERLELEGARVERGAHARQALRLLGAFNPFVTRAFHDGAFELQDEGSQLVAELTAPPPRGLVVDACAGSGGKALALSAMLEGRGKLLALDVDAHKLIELRRRAKRAGAVNVQALALELEGELPEAARQALGRADRLLVDAPCSGSGVLRRNPEARHTLSPELVTRLAASQLAIVERLLPLLAPGGRLLFATCSLLREEGEQVMDAVEAAHPELVPVDLAEIYDRAYVDRFVRSARHRLRLLPHLHDTDGFFIACLRRRR